MGHALHHIAYDCPNLILYLLFHVDCLSDHLLDDRQTFSAVGR